MKRFLKSGDLSVDLLPKVSERSDSIASALEEGLSFFCNSGGIMAYSLFDNLVIRKLKTVPRKKKNILKFKCSVITH